jgi:protein disulfide-isomerase
MKLTSLALLFSAVTSGIAQAVGADTTDDPEKENTYFNGKRVPPLLELTADTFEKEVQASKFLVVKYFKYEDPSLLPASL